MNFKILGLAAGLLTAPLTAYAQQEYQPTKGVENIFTKKHERQFGTLENLKYKASKYKTFNYNNIETTQTYLQSELETLESLERRINMKYEGLLEGHKALDKLLKGKKETKKLNEIIGRRSFPFAEEYLQKKEIKTSTVSYEEGTKIYGDFFEGNKRAIRKLVKSNPNKMISLEIDSLFQPFENGMYDIFNYNISLNKTTYEEMIQAYFHQVGHACAQHSEEIIKGRETPTSMLMDEAAAYAMMFQSHQTQVNKSLRVRLKVLNEKAQVELTRAYFDGGKDIHFEAAALADAAITYFGKPEQAFNYLASTKYENLDNKLLETLEDIRALHNQVKEKRAQLGQLSNDTVELLKTHNEKLQQYKTSDLKLSRDIEKRKKEKKDRDKRSKFDRKLERKFKRSGF